MSYSAESNKKNKVFLVFAAFFYRFFHIQTHLKEKLLNEEEKQEFNNFENSYVNKMTVITNKIQNWNRINNEIESKVLKQFFF